MLRRVLSAAPALALTVALSLALALASLPAVSFALDLKPKQAESAFTAKLHPDILGVSTDAAADAALAMLESAFKGRAGTRADIGKQAFGSDTAGYVAAVTFDQAAAAKQGG